MKHIVLSTLIATTITSGSFAKTLTFSTINTAEVRHPITEIMKEAYRRINIDIKIEELPAKRAIIAANEGKYDGDLFRIKGINKEYPNLIMVSTPCHSFDVHCFVQKKNAFEVNGWESIPKDHAIGIRLGVKYLEKRVTKYSLKAELIPDNPSAFKMLTHGRLDLVVTGKNEGDKIIKENEYNALMRLDPCLEQIQSFHYLHKKHADLLPQVEKALLEMKEDGTFETILNKY